MDIPDIVSAVNRNRCKMKFIASHFAENRRPLLVLMMFLVFAVGVLIAYRPIVTITCLMLGFLGILLPPSLLTWLAISMAPLQWTVIGLQNIPYKISCYDVIALLLVINFVWNGAIKKFSMFEQRLAYILALFCLAGLISLTQAPYAMPGIYYLIRLGVVFITFFSVIYFVREHSLEHSLSSLFACLWLLGIAAVINALQAPETVQSTVNLLLEDPGSAERLGSVYNQPNITGHTIGLFLPIFFGSVFLPGQRRIIRLLSVITTIFLSFVLIFTGSRGGMLTGAIGLLILIFYLRRFSLLIIPLVLLGFFVFNWAFMREFFFDVRSLSMENRINLIYYGLKTALEHPIAGIGLRQFNTHFHNMPFYLAGRSSHNAYLEVLVEMGILGFGVFIAFIVFVWKALINTPDQKKQFTTVLRGIALSSFASLLCSKLFMGGLVLATWWIALAFILGFMQRFYRSSF